MAKSVVLRGSGFQGVRRYRGFTLTEIIVGLALFAVAIVGVAGALRQGRTMLFESENKGSALSAAQSALERYLAMSYGDLENWVADHPQQPVLVSDLSDQDDATGCYASVIKSFMATSVAGKAAGKSDIPYYAVSVRCDYKDEGVSKKVALSGIVPYPYLQIVALTKQDLSPQVVAIKDVESTVLSYTFNPVVRSNLMIFYDLSINVEDNGTSISGTDLLITQCKITNSKNTNTPIGIPTGTPIMTQPSISNVLGVAAGVSGGSAAVNKGKIIPGEDNTISVVWKKDRAGGKITLKKGNIIILRTENNK